MTVTHMRAPWVGLLLAYPCPTCGAQPSEDCVTRNGQPAQQPHTDRARNATRCPRCGQKLVSDVDDPGAYCSRCQLLRSLEIERVTRHRRRT
jgi:DNA-directed RNA polymerase subunit RPC12/RpoP